MRGRFAWPDAVDDIDARLRGLSGLGVVGGGEDMLCVVLR
jgi:hypothetical protein